MVAKPWRFRETAIRFLLFSQAAAFLTASLLHLGVRIPLGFATLQEPRIVPATIVEALCGLFLAFSAYGIFTRRTWARRAAMAAHLFAIAGVLLGMIVGCRQGTPHADKRPVPSSNVGDPHGRLGPAMVTGRERCDRDPRHKRRCTT